MIEKLRKTSHEPICTNDTAYDKFFSSRECEYGVYPNNTDHLYFKILCKCLYQTSELPPMHCYPCREVDPTQTLHIQNVKK